MKDPTRCRTFLGNVTDMRERKMIERNKSNLDFVKLNVQQKRRFSMLDPHVRHDEAKQRK
jgi:hypothetical protein